MENKDQIPSLQDLILMWNSHNNQFGSNGQPSLVLMQQIIDILKYSQEFHEYIKHNGEYDNIYLSYIVYANIVYYIKYCYDNKDYEAISKMFIFLDLKLKVNNKDIQTLIHVGVLELFDSIKLVLPEVLPMMPIDLRKYFLKHFSRYLN